MRCVRVSASSRNCWASLRLGGELLDHLAVVGGQAEGLAVELDDLRRLEVERDREFLDRDLRPLRRLGHVDDEVRRPVVGAVLLQQIDEVLGVAQVGEVGHGGDDDLVGLQQHALHPRRPGVRQVDGDVGHVLAHDIETRSQASAEMS